MNPGLTWDMEVYYPGFDSSPFQEDVERVRAAINRYGELLDQGDLEAILAHRAELNQLGNLVYTYVMCRVCEDSRDETALAQESELEILMAEVAKLNTRFDAWVGTLENPSGPLAKEHAYLLERARHRAQKQMAPGEEALAADLNLSGAVAWARMHSAITSQLEVQIGEETIPMSAARNWAFRTDRGDRQRAYEAELAAWRTVEVPLAAAMNGIKGQVGLLCRQRGWGEGLDEAVFDNGVDRKTLDAMMGAAHACFPDFRRYMRAKAKALGLARLEWYDLFAPVGETRKWDVEEANTFVAEQFDAYSPKMGDFARRAFQERWIDYPPRAGKVDGAFCAGTRDDRSLILMNYTGAFNNVKTLAHELGHAYHNLCLSEKSPLLRGTPSTLAETASIFCETVVKNAALASAEGNERLAMLEANLQGPCQTVVDITSRYLFEKAVFADRARRDLSPNELCERMLEAQRETYGDGLASYHPYMWAVKPHYYSTSSFYNFPYMFGLLFALGLYAEYQVKPEGFQDRYDGLLAATGEADAATLGHRFGFDLQSSRFWEGSLNVLREEIDAFEAAVESL